MILNLLIDINLITNVVGDDTMEVEFGRNCKGLFMIKALVHKRNFTLAFSHQMNSGPTLKGDLAEILKIK